jgi:hypothetical protein
MDAQSFFGCHVCVDHRGLQVGVSQQVLDGPDIIPCLKQMGRKRVPQRMDGHPFGNIRGCSSPLDMPLKGERVYVVPSEYFCSWIRR